MMMMMMMLMVRRVEVSYLHFLHRQRNAHYHSVTAALAPLSEGQVHFELIVHFVDR